MFEFPKADRSGIDNFKSNYLKTVIFQVKYPDTDILVSNKESIHSEFIETFPRCSDNNSKGFEITMKSDQTPILQPISDKNLGFELKSTNGQSILSFTRDSITFTISGQEYKNFGHIKNMLESICNVLINYSINSVNRLAIRKINMLDFRIPENQDTTPMEFLSFVLNKELQDYSAYLPNQDYINQNLHTINYSKDYDKLNLRFGLVVTKPEKKEGHVLLDIDRYTTEDLSCTFLSERFGTINDEIFNIFNWALQENVINHIQE